jgi:hypothetical protein
MLDMLPANDLVTKAQFRPDVSVLHELQKKRIQVFHLFHGKFKGPFSTISPTKTLEKPAMICATGCET